MIKRIHQSGKQLRVNLPEFIKNDQEIKLSKGDHVQFSKVKLPNGGFVLVLSKVEPINKDIFMQKGNEK